MTDYTELKLAAEAASQGRWNQDGFDVQNDDINDYRVARCNRLADAKFIAVANPAAFLALIAENDRLSQTVESLIQMERTTGNRAIEYAGKCDDLKAEVAGLRTGYEAYERVNAELKAEVEALKKRIDDMSPFKGAPLTGPDLKCLACGGYHYGLQGLPCPNMRITASAALGQGEQS